MHTPPNQPGIFSFQCLRLSNAASLILRRSTKLGLIFRIASSGGSVISSVAKTPTLNPCKLNDQSHGTSGKSANTLWINQGNAF